MIVAIYRSYSQARVSTIHSNFKSVDNCVLVRVEQLWKPTKSHSFPLNDRVLPVGHEAIKHKWQSSFPPGSSLFRRYLNDIAIETNQIEGVFLMTAEVRTYSDPK